MHAVTLFLLSITTGLLDDMTLSGTIRNEDGAAISGAKIDIYTAKPKVGVATICPSCYSDCEKSTTTDANGRFSIGGLDPSLLFRVLVLAPGHRSHLTDSMDPQFDDVDVKLEAYPKDLPDDRMLTGRVVDPDGKPVVGAVVYPLGAKSSERHLWGRLPDVDEASVTDVDGRFVITTREPKLGLDLRAYAPGFAVYSSRHFVMNGQEHEIQLQLGASVLGKLVYEGQPVGNRAVGMVQRNRSFQSFAGERVVGTDRDGNFEFTDLQPNEDYVLYTLCETNQELAKQDPPVQSLPVLKTHLLKTAFPGRSTEVGTLELVPGVSISGRIELPSGVERPAEVTVRLNRDPARDTCVATVGEDGEFHFHSLPAEIYSVIVTAPGFEIDAGRSAFQVTGPTQFGMRLRGDGRASMDITIPLQPVTTSESAD